MASFRASVFALALVAALAGCAAPLAPAAVQTSPSALVDPAPFALPPLEIENVTYDFGVMAATTARASYPSLVRVHGTMYAPLEGGPHPVLLFMHGNHRTCILEGVGGVPGAGVCRDVGPMRVDPSFAGYSYLAEDLAARGHVVVSINANDVNDNNMVDDLGSNQRGQLFLRTLDDLAALGDPRFDLTRIGLMGHSRGGDGAARAVALNAERADPHSILAVLALAPTDFVRHKVEGVAFGTILPYCDGDVSNLQGAWLYDDARYLPDAGPLHQWLVMGTNHNWYNEVWDTDDARWRYDDDPECEPKSASRLSPEDTRAVGLALMGSFFRAYVSGEEALLPALRDAALVMPGTVHASYMPPAGDRLTIEDTLDEDALTANDRGGAVALEGASEPSVCTTRAAASGPIPLSFVRVPVVQPVPEGTCPTEPNAATAPQLTFAHSASARATWSFEPLDASSFREVSLRLSLDFDAAKGLPAFAFELSDASGASARVPARGGAFLPPGDDAAKLVLNDVRAPLAGFEGVDITRLAGVALVIEGAEGRVQVTDVMLRR